MNFKISGIIISLLSFNLNLYGQWITSSPSIITASGYYNLEIDCPTLTGNYPQLIFNNKTTNGYKGNIIFEQDGSQKAAMGIDINNNNSNNFYIWDQTANNGSGGTKFFIDADGKLGVGLGNTSPVSLIHMNLPSSSTFPGILINGSFNNSLSSYYFQAGPSSSSSVFKIRGDGVVVIGSNTMEKDNSSNYITGYNLFVQNGILTEKVKVAVNGTLNWSDFVFEKSYRLLPLNDLESFIKKNHHLPEIPSQEDVNNNGVDLLEMESKLLQKIEELTLYIIEIKKEVELLKKENKELKDQLKNQ